MCFIMWRARLTSCCVTRFPFQLSPVFTLAFQLLFQSPESVSFHSSAPIPPLSSLPAVPAGWIIWAKVIVAFQFLKSLSFKTLMQDRHCSSSLLLRRGWWNAWSHTHWYHCKFRVCRLTWAPSGFCQSPSCPCQLAFPFLARIPKSHYSPQVLSLSADELAPILLRKLSLSDFTSFKFQPFHLRL